MTTIRSRIMEYIPEAVAKDLRRICKDKSISDNNEKATLIHAVLTRAGIDFVELGPGTNRYAVLIEGYVFKIAMDRWGQRDNANEFATSHELQPYVVKTYELSDDYVITVCEYITVISKEEFIEQKDVLREILSILAESYLLGDVGTVPKNFTNWGYRDNGDLVILDYAYVYRIIGNELLCTEDQTILEYDENYHKMYCPTCRARTAGRKGTFDFMDLRRRITIEHENNEQQEAIDDSYKLTSAKQEFKEEVEPVYTEAQASLNTNKESSTFKEEEDMKNRGYQNSRYNEVEEESTDPYIEALEAMSKHRSVETNVDLPDEVVEVLDSSSTTVKTNILDVETENEKGRTHVRVINQEPVTAGEEAKPVDKSIVEDVSEKALDALAGAQDVLDQFENGENTIEGEAKEVIDGVVVEPSEDDTDSSEETSETEAGENVAHIVDDLSEEEQNELRSHLDDEDALSHLDGGDDEESTEGSYSSMSSHFETYASQADGVKDVSEPEETDEKEVLYGEVLDVDHKETETSEVIVSEHEVRIDDKVSIKNTITVDKSVDTDELRKSLLDDDDETESRVEQLSEEYRHLEDDEDDRHQRGPRKWK